MGNAAAQLHSGAGLRWLSDSLPALATVLRSGLTFDLILLSVVWMDVPPGDRPRAFRKMIDLLRPGGLIAIALRHGPAEPEKGIHPVSTSELEVLARNHGAFVQSSVEAKDKLGRNQVRWTHVEIWLPDDGTGALPLLRHVLLNDERSSTYKLALLRALCRVADGAGGFAGDHDDESVAVPLRFVALTWICSPNGPDEPGLVGGLVAILNRIELRAVGRQEEQAWAGRRPQRTSEKAWRTRLTSRAAGFSVITNGPLWRFEQIVEGRACANIAAKPPGQ